MLLKQHELPRARVSVRHYSTAFIEQVFPMFEAQLPAHVSFSLEVGLRFHR